MKQSRAKRLYIQGMIKSLMTTPCECKALILALEQITGVKSKCEDRK